jgi:hypothetical protein
LFGYYHDSKAVSGVGWGGGIPLFWYSGDRPGGSLARALLKQVIFCMEALRGIFFGAPHFFYYRLRGVHHDPDCYRHYQFP